MGAKPGQGVYFSRSLAVAVRFGGEQLRLLEPSFQKGIPGSVSAYYHRSEGWPASVACWSACDNTALASSVRPT